jgi:hypothetical protein
LISYNVQEARGSLSNGDDPASIPLFHWKIEPAMEYRLLPVHNWKICLGRTVDHRLPRPGISRGHYLFWKPSHCSPVACPRKEFEKRCFLHKICLRNVPTPSTLQNHNSRIYGKKSGTSSNDFFLHMAGGAAKNSSDDLGR